MDFIPIAFLILFVLLGGVIAVIADNLGRKFGKKRLSLLGLRPKHTATVITFGAGSLISLATIALVTIVSSDVRQWILEGRYAALKANQDKEVAERQLRQTQKDLDRKQREVEAQATRLTGLQRRIEKLNPEIVRLSSAVTSADERVKRIEKSRALVVNDLNRRRSDLEDAKKQLTSNKVALEKLEEQRIQQQQLAREAATQKAETDRQNTLLTQQNQGLEKEIKALESDVDRLRSDTATLESARDDAKQDLDAAQKQLSSFQDQLKTAEDELKRTEQLLSTARLQVGVFQQFNDQARTQAATYHINEEVARMPVMSGLSANSAEQVLESLIVMAQRNASERGAKSTDRAPVAGIYEHIDPETERRISAQEIQSSIVKRITRSPIPLLVVAYSSLNAFRNEPVSLEVQLFPNPLVYRKGEVIAESRIDGSRSTQQIYRQLEDLLEVKVRSRAIEDKMLPNLGSDQFGVVTPEDIYQLMDEVREADRSVRVQAIALSDTRAGDPLNLEFRVRP